MATKSRAASVPSRLPQYPRYRLQVAAYAGFLACICAVPQFLPTLQRTLQQHLYVMAILFTYAAATLNSKTFMVGPWNLLISICTGSSVGYAIVLLETAMGGGVYNHFFGVLLAFPFILLSSMVQATSKCKLAEFYSYIPGNLMIVAVVAFSASEPLRCLYSAMFAGVFMFVVLLTITGALNILGLLPLAAPEPLAAFEHAAATGFQMSVCYVLDGDLHQREMAEQRQQLVIARRAALTSASDANLRLCIFRMISTLYGLRRAARYEPFSETAVIHLWEPMQMELGRLVTKVTALLKHEVEVEDIPDLKAAARDALIKIKKISIEYTRAVADQKSVVISAREMARVEFAIEAGNSKTFNLELRKNLANATVTFPFLKQRPMWPPGMSFRDKLAFPLRLAVSITITVEAALGVGQAYPILRTEGFWFCLPVLTCFLPTVGWTIGKGSRRMLGVLIGGALAMLIVYVNSMNIPAVMVELFLVASVGKFFTLDPRIGYLGFQTVVTFTIVGVCNALDPALDGDIRITLAWLRMLLTVLGLCTAIFLSLISYPSFCGRRLAVQTSKELLCASDAVSALVKGVTAREPDGSVSPEERGMPTMVDIGMSLLKEDSARLAERPWFDEEAMYLQFIHANPTRCSVSAKCLAAAQGDVARLSRSAVVVEQAFWSCDKKMSPATDRLLLGPIKPLLNDVVKHLQLSAQALDGTLHGVVDTKPAICLAEETLELMLYLYATFEENRANLLFKRTWAAEGEVTESTHMVEVMNSGGGVGLHEAIHAINAFVEDWVTVVNSLLACQLSIPNSAAEAPVSSFGSIDTCPGSTNSEFTRLRAGTCAY
ncbi:hypothetical protein FOL47_010452 [Perkinsus chesapeaki]|uniref:Aluminum-activated malate transporter 1 n=1 Tax=Perkinsus chesapeaki TaxID=330153 RepID=A0A7J6MPW1_PERCH|nr:hypothetical protein FOL47_010452 [Perkinsus chesapeaki]